VPDEPRDELSRTLRQLRADPGLSGTAAAALVGLTQASISRYEAGRFVPAPEDVATLARAYGAPPDVRARLVQLARDLRENTVAPARVVMARGAGRMQLRIGRIEQASAQIRHFHPVVIVGLLQTAEYMRAVFSSGGDMPAGQIDEAVAARLERQAILREPGRRFTFLMTEGALRWQIGDPLLMIDQLKRVFDATRLPGLRVGIIPWTTAVTVAPMHGFDVYDERAAIIGTEIATAFLTNPHDVAALGKLFADLEAVASYDRDARRVLVRVADDYRSLT
jgi:transcriptional regulator with XRE-family HTH domain